MTDRAVSPDSVRLIRMRELPPIVGLKPAMIYRLRALGEFPQPVKRHGREALPFDETPRFLVRDGDAIYGEKVRRQLQAMRVEEVATAPASPWQNACAERLIGFDVSCSIT